MTARVLFATGLLVLSHPGVAPSQDEQPPAAPATASPEPTEAEAAFAAMLTEATLNGTWAPIDKRMLGDDQDDAYYIVKATKLDGDKWALVSRFKFQGQQVDFPVPVVVKFAGDSAVVILNNVPLGDGTTWSARILFHDDVYAGSWWGNNKAEKSGIVSGTVTR